MGEKEAKSELTTDDKLDSVINKYCNCNGLRPVWASVTLGQP